MDTKLENFPPLSPDARVAARIVARFLDEKLIHPEQVTDLERQLAEGTITAAKWDSIAEHAQEMETRIGTQAD